MQETASNGLMKKQKVLNNNLNRSTRPTDAWPTFVHAAYSTETGQLLWTQNRTNIGDMKYPVYIKPYTGIYALPYRENKQWIIWDMKTGNELWRLDGPEDDWGIFDVGGGFAGDIFYTAGFRWNSNRIQHDNWPKSMGILQRQLRISTPHTVLGLSMAPQ